LCLFWNGGKLASGTILEVTISGFSLKGKRWERQLATGLASLLVSHIFAFGAEDLSYTRAEWVVIYFWAGDILDCTSRVGACRREARHGGDFL